MWVGGKTYKLAHKAETNFLLSWSVFYCTLLISWNQNCFTIQQLPGFIHNGWCVEMCTRTVTDEEPSVDGGKNIVAHCKQYPFKNLPPTFFCDHQKDRCCVSCSNMKNVSIFPKFQVWIRCGWCAQCWPAQLRTSTILRVCRWLVCTFEWSVCAICAHWPSTSTQMVGCINAHTNHWHKYISGRCANHFLSPCHMSVPSVYAYYGPLKEAVLRKILFHAIIIMHITSPKWWEIAQHQNWTTPSKLRAARLHQ